VTPAVKHLTPPVNHSSWKPPLPDTMRQRDRRQQTASHGIASDVLPYTSVIKRVTSAHATGARPTHVAAPA